MKAAEGAKIADTLRQTKAELDAIKKERAVWQSDKDRLALQLSALQKERETEKAAAAQHAKKGSTMRKDSISAFGASIMKVAVAHRMQEQKAICSYKSHKS